jgi:hypothetical protein
VPSSSGSSSPRKITKQEKVSPISTSGIRRHWKNTGKLLAQTACHLTEVINEKGELLENWKKTKLKTILLDSPSLGENSAKSSAAFIQKVT